MKRQQAEAALNRFLEESGNAVPAQSDVEPVLDRVWERLQWRADEFVGARIPAAPARPFRFVWAVGIVLAAVLVSALVWREGPPFSAAGKTGIPLLSKSASQQARETLQVAVPQDAFELASVKLVAPDSEAGRRAQQFDELGARMLGCAGGYLGGTRVDPGRLTIPAASVLSLVILAYGQECTLVEGGPAWARSGEHYEIQALLPAGTPSYTAQDLQKGNAPEPQRMLQNLLANRFRLVVKRELREMPVYTLTVATPGKLKLSADETMAASDLKVPPDFPPPQPIGRGQKLVLMGLGDVQLLGHGISMLELARDLRQHAGRIVVDRTGYGSVLDYYLRFSPNVAPVLPPAATAVTPSPQSIPPPPGALSPLPTLRDEINEKLGLRLESARMPIEVLIIESVERPSEN